MNSENNINSRILVIDDDEISKKFISKVLEDKYDVFLFSEKMDIEQFIISHKINLIILDYIMPEINGIDLAKKLFSIFEKNHINIPIILLTSSEDNSLIKEAFSIGISDYIRKPINHVELIARIENQLGKHSLNYKLHQQNQEFIEYQRVVNESNIVSKADLNGVITYANDKFCEISGYSKEELIGSNHNILRHPETPKELFKEMWDTLKAKKTFTSIIKNKRKNGESYYVNSTISPILGLNNEIIEYLAIRHDITSMMNPKNQMLDFIKHSSNSTVVLAQIANYDMIREFYSEKIRSDFEINFEKTLFNSLPAHTSVKKVYNLGSGLFGFIKTSEHTPTTINLFLEEMLKKIRTSGVEFENNRYEVDVVFSFSTRGTHLYEDCLIGIYHALESQESIVYADDFYVKKQITAKEKLKTLTSIRNALKQNDKVVSYYQPIVENRTKKIVKYESLIRMINSKGEVLTPYHFLELAKKTGYYHDITLRVIENANNILDISDINININLSLSDLKDVQIRTELLNLITKEKNRGRITFELLEDETIKDFSLVKDFIGLSKLLGGVTIAIDDFGSGYSNYERLLDFQPDYIKIDGSLVRNIQDSYSRSVIKSIVLFAKENNLKTVAEFVGDVETYDAVFELGIDYSQGFYFGKPEPFNSKN